MGDATDLLMDESSFEWKREEMSEFACAFFDRVVLEWREEIILDKKVIDRVLRDERIDGLLLDAPEQHRRMWAVICHDDEGHRCAGEQSGQ